MPTRDVLSRATVTVVVSVCAMKLVVSAVLIAIGQLPAPKSEITPEDESTVQIELAAVVPKVSDPKLELVVTVGVSVAPGRKMATFEFG
jgi:hypothetical protein